MIGQIEERVDLCDGHSILRFSHPNDFIARANFAFPQHTQVEPGPSARCQQRRHSGLVHPNADAIAGNAWLCDLELRAADLKSVANAHLIVGQSFDGKVLTELSVNELGPPQLFLPITIGFDLVNKDGALLTAVPGKITLTVSVQIQLADSAAAANGIFPDTGVHNATFPFDVARKSNIHREESGHIIRSWVQSGGSRRSDLRSTPDARGKLGRHFQLSSFGLAIICRERELRVREYFGDFIPA